MIARLPDTTKIFVEVDASNEDGVILLRVTPAEATELIATLFLSWLNEEAQGTLQRFKREEERHVHL